MLNIKQDKCVIEMTLGNFSIKNNKDKPILSAHTPNSRALYHLIDQSLYAEKMYLKPNVSHDYTNVHNWYYTDCLKNSTVTITRLILEIRKGRYFLTAYCTIDSLVQTSHKIIRKDHLPPQIISLAKRWCEEVKAETFQR